MFRTDHSITANRLILVRHGETVGNSSIRYFGRTDVRLSELGRMQMLSAAKWLKSHLRTTDFTPVFASALHRAIEGARLIAGAAAPIVTIQEFAEVDFGEFEGLTAAEIRERYPADFKRWNRDPLDLTYTYPGGESRAAFVARVGHGVQRMLELLDSAASTTGSTTSLLVAHRGVICAITKQLADVVPTIELGSIQILRRTPGNPGWCTEALDVAEHLIGLE